VGSGVVAEPPFGVDKSAATGRMTDVVVLERNFDLAKVFYRRM
jgi:predicted RNA methylase